MKKRRKSIAFITASITILSCFSGSPAAALASPGETATGVPLSEIEAVVDEIMEGKIGVDVPGTAVSIVKDGELIFSKGYGLASIEKAIPVDPATTLFEIGSVSKIFTWTAIMQLAEQGKLDLNTDIREYIDYDRLNLTFEKPITIMDLLNHTAGFEENASEMMTFDKEKVIPLEQWISAKHQPKQVYEPGTVIAYSNFSTDIAGYIVQVKSGMLYEEYVKKYIFEPLQMEQSTAYTNYYHLPGFAENKSKGYGPGKIGLELLPENFINEAPAGAIISTAEDMAKFMIAQMNYEGISDYSLFQTSETLYSMHTDTFSINESMPSNAHGFWARQESGIRLLEHGGNTTNFSALLSIAPEENFGICVLTNVAGESVGVRTDIVDKLSARFTHEATVSVQNPHSQNLSGTYYSGRMIHSTFLSTFHLLSSDSIIVKDLNNGEIEVRLSAVPNRETLRFAEVSPLVFERTDSSPSIIDKSGAAFSFLSFELNENGQVNKVRTGNIRDYLKIPLYKNPQTGQIGFAICSLIFLIGSAGAFVSLILSKKRKKQGTALDIPAYNQTNMLPVLGLLTIINMSAALMRFMSSMTSPIGDLKIHLLLNVAFTIAMIVVAIPIASSFNNTRLIARRKIWNAVLIAAACLLVSFMLQYHFFSFWAI